jgi:hypothetical protein
VDPPANEDEPFDLIGEATGCESLYHDTKGDTRYLDQKADFEELAAKVESALNTAPPPVKPVKNTPTFEPPVTRRKLEGIGLEWPWPYPLDVDEAVDLERAMADLTYGDLMEYTGGRGSYLELQRNRTQAIIDRLNELGIAWRVPNAPKRRS